MTFDRVPIVDFVPTDSIVATMHFGVLNREKWIQINKQTTNNILRIAWSELSDRCFECCDIWTAINTTTDSIGCCRWSCIRRCFWRKKKPIFWRMNENRKIDRYNLQEFVVIVCWNWLTFRSKRSIRVINVN